MDNILERQRQWATRTFGPHTRPGRTDGVIDHIKKELAEAESNPRGLEEWLDLMILSAEGAFCQGFSARDIVRGYEAKLQKLEGRAYPDWRTQPQGKAIEHIRTPEEQARKDAELRRHSSSGGDQFGGFERDSMPVFPRGRTADEILRAGPPTPRAAPMQSSAEANNCEQEEGA